MQIYITVCQISEFFCLRLNLYQAPWIFQNSQTFESTPLIFSLRGRHFFHINPGHWVPACVRISISIPCAVANPESHAHLAFVDFIADTFDVTWAVQIIFSAARSFIHIDCSINSCWCRAFYTIKSEIPSPATSVAVIDAELATPVDAQTCAVWPLLENTILLKKKKQKQQWRRCKDEILWCYSFRLQTATGLYFPVVLFLIL